MESSGLIEKNRQGKLYLITGGLGYIGSRLADHLLREKNSIRITTRRPIETCPDWAKDWDIFQVNALDKGTWMKALEDVDFVFHLAAPDAESAGSDPVSALRAGGEMTWTLLDALRETTKKAPVINVSTFHVYGLNKEGLIGEATPPRPVHPYAVGHLFSEIVIQNFCSRWNTYGINVRLSNVFGTPMAFDSAKWSLVFNDLCMQAATSHQLCLKSVGYQKRNFITLEDAVHALTFLADRYNEWPEDHIMHVGSNIYWSIRDVAEHIADRCKVLWGKRLKIIIPEDKGDPTPKDFKFDVSRLENAGFIWQNQVEREIDGTLIACKKWGERK